MRKNPKFTLIEVMTAIAVFSIFMVLIIQFFVAAQRLWGATEQSARLNNKAALVFNTIERYIRHAGTGYSAFYVHNSQSDPFQIMRAQFQGIRWEQDDDAYNEDNSTKLIFAATSSAVLHSAAVGDFYLLGFVQAQDRIQLRVICDQETSPASFFTLCNYDRDPLLSLFRSNQRSWLRDVPDDEYGSGQEGECRVTYNLIDHVTDFKVYSYRLNTTDNISGPLMMCAEDDITKDAPPYSLLVQIKILSDNDYAKWKALCEGETSEPDAAKAFREKAEHTFSRMIYVGKAKEVS